MNDAKIALPRGIKLLLAANFLAVLGLIAQTTILGKQIFDMTGREIDLGFLGLAEFLPTALLAPFTGSISDRFDRRLITGLAMLVELLVAIGLFIYMRGDPTSLAPIFILSVFFGIGRAFMAPAIRALPIDMAPAGRVEKVVALGNVTRMTARIIGPVIAGFVFVIGPEWPYAVTAMFLIAAIAVVALLPISGVAKLEAPKAGSSMIKEAFEGIGFIRRTPILLGAISLDLFAVLLGGVVALLPAIAEDRLGVGSVGLGWLRAAMGIGAALTTVAIARRPVARHIGKTLIASVAIFGVATISLGLTKSFAIAFIAILILGSADSVSVFIRSTLVPLAAPSQMRGRVLAVEAVFIGGSNELGAFESGVAAAFLGLVGAIVFGGVGTLVVAGTWWLVFPKLRDIDRFSEILPTNETRDPDSPL